MDHLFRDMELGLNTLTVFRNVVKDPVLEPFRDLCASLTNLDCLKAADSYSEVFFRLAEAGFSDIGAYVIDLAECAETAFSKALAAGSPDTRLEQAARRDVGILADVSGISCGLIKEELIRQSESAAILLFGDLPEWETKQAIDFDRLRDFYRKNGSGVFAHHRELLWSRGAFAPALLPDRIRYEDMIGYQWQREAVFNNTKALLQGHMVNNILLYGDSGTANRRPSSRC
jgi:hypothetical protein